MRTSLKWISAVIAIGFLSSSLAGCAERKEISQVELVRRTQELVDAASTGDTSPWKKYYADDATYFDEKGRNMNKAALIADVTPLPAGYSGSIRVADPQSHIENDVAILSYDLNETETVFGQELHARYHGTDTWIRRRGEWQIIAGQVLRYYADPAPGKADPRAFSAYAGTYELAPGSSLMVFIEADQLYRQRGERPKELLIPEAADIFFRKSVEGRILFRHAANGKVDALINRRNDEDVIWKRMP